MVEHEPSVALLFDDAGLSAHLRDALVAQGARIVYESDLKAFAPAELVGSSADVVVVDLDDPSDSDLDRLYETVEGGHPRLVFNDADASRDLAGWDRARWARHLAAKLVGGSPLDPPRPEEARAIEPRVAAIASEPAPAEEVLAEPITDELSITGVHGYPDAPSPVEAAEPFPASLEPLSLGDDELAFSTPLTDASDEENGVGPEDLAAELEAVLAETGAAEVQGTDGIDDLPSLPLELTDLASLDLSGFEVVDESPAPTPPVEHEFDASQFSLASEDEPSAVASSTNDDSPALEITSRSTQYVPPPVPEWDLVDHDTIVAESAPSANPAEFGIETMSAAEYLAQDVVDDGSVAIEAGLKLELVSLEEAIAPSTDGKFMHEMILETTSRAVRRVVALAGTVESEDAIRLFLAAMPGRLPATLLVVAHHADDTAAFAQRLGRGRVATDGVPTNHGEVLVVPRGAHVQIRRDGSVTVRDDGSAFNAAGPSIDGIFSTLAGGFGADALAIVFAGRGNDAVAGAQAVYDGGGRVWVQAVAPEDERGHMVTGIREERVAGYAGDVAALARKLNEEFP
ncbi:chemotaxis protein CheB [Luteibacter aegosomatissinici]|uniref:chemotaxis protein CheB n=1 Tax=Luteibacter aegosomatissinici TaxID=2911539 RepID=UPI001FF7B7D5|nr:chemotaxis protein CheB [Luteibacter aegosomatissinici]UPG93440.1 chemotaxis protein CheB [Luteibacter aegosomatissinici]